MKKSIAFVAVAVVAAGAGYRYSHRSASLALSLVERQSLHDAPNDDQQAQNGIWSRLKEKFGLDPANAPAAAVPPPAPSQSDRVQSHARAVCAAHDDQYDEDEPALDECMKTLENSSFDQAALDVCDTFKSSVPFIKCIKAIANRSSDDAMKALDAFKATAKTTTKATAKGQAPRGDEAAADPRPALCSSDADCQSTGAANVCRGGICAVLSAQPPLPHSWSHAACDSDADCQGVDNACLEGKCSQSGYGCQFDADCPDNNFCYIGKCKMRTGL
jgi:hypothetical protein